MRFWQINETLKCEIHTKLFKNTITTKINARCKSLEYNGIIDDWFTKRNAVKKLSMNLASPCQISM